MRYCPFCNGEDVEIVPDGHGWNVGCLPCDYKIHVADCTEAEAIRFWNTRPAEDALKAVNERLREKITRYRRALHNLKEDCQRRMKWTSISHEKLFLNKAITHIDAELAIDVSTKGGEDEN